LVFCTGEYCEEGNNDYISKRLHSEIGVLQLRRQDYFEAMDNLVQGEMWEDVAYLAENVLTIDELEGYLIDRQTGYSWPILDYYKSSRIKENATYFDALRYLLARRMGRSGLWERAIEYMPGILEVVWRKRTPSGKGYLIHTYENSSINPKQEAKNYYENIQHAQNEGYSKIDRAKNYYEAGKLLRFIGMEIIGTELEPDWFVYDGQFSSDGPLAQRFGDYSQERLDRYKDWSSDWGKKYTQELIDDQKIRQKEFEEGQDFFLASKDERDRAVESLPTPRKRWHYRFKAADLMWKSAELLPNGDILKAEALWEGGLYLRDRDNEAADKFYKELVKTCKNTILGAEADRIRWFPKREWYEKAKAEIK